MNLTNFNIKDFFISNNFPICENSNNILTTTKNILIYQIILLFIMSLNKLFRIVLSKKNTPIILNIPHHIKHSELPLHNKDGIKIRKEQQN